MTGSYHDPNWAEQISVPVRRVGDRWEFFYGGDVPVRDGALGHLTVGAAQVTDQAFLQRLHQPPVVKVLPEGAPLLVALSDRLERNMPQNFVESTAISLNHALTMLADSWLALEQKLGWRPVVRPGKKKAGG